MLKGADCGGIVSGKGSKFFGSPNVRREASRKGSTCLRYVVKTSGSFRGLPNG